VGAGGRLVSAPVELCALMKAAKTPARLTHGNRGNGGNSGQFREMQFFEIRKKGPK
jgi:hypothetical protein